MIIFDGTNSKTINKSIADILQLDLWIFHNLIQEFVLTHYPEILQGEISLINFLDYLVSCKIKIDINSLNFDKIILFHRTSVIDNGKFIHDNGLLNLHDILFRNSPINNHLKKKGIEFFIKDGIPFISIDGISNIIKENKIGSFSYENKVRFKLDHPEGIGGYLFISDTKSDHTYDRIKYIPEFLFDVDQWQKNRDISNDWENRAKPYILACEVDINWLDIQNQNKQQKSVNERTMEIAEYGFMYLIEIFLKRKMKIIRRLVSIDYFFLNQGICIPSDRIRFIGY